MTEAHLDDVLPPPGLVVTANVGEVTEVRWRDEIIHTGIWKYPVGGRVPTQGHNLAGDEQADRRAHGGPDKAVYAYALEDEAWWATELGEPIKPGTFGENLTVANIDVTNADIGERWEVGGALLEVCQPRTPCHKLDARMNDPHFQQRFKAALRPGAYLRIIRPGDVGSGDSVRVVSRPAHGVTIADVAQIIWHDWSQAARLLDVPELAASLRERIARSVRQ